MNQKKELQKVLNECAWESIPKDKIRSLANIITIEDIDWLIEEIKYLDLAKLKDDSSDISDEYWRTTVAISALIISLGKEALQRLLIYESCEHTYVQMALKFIKNDKYLTEYKLGFFRN